MNKDMGFEKVCSRKRFVMISPGGRKMLVVMVMEEKKRERREGDV